MNIKSGKELKEYLATKLDLTSKQFMLLHPTADTKEFIFCKNDKLFHMCIKASYQEDGWRDHMTKEYLDELISRLEL